jgi:hypothetical protein
MMRVRGVYDGVSVRLLEDVDIAPDTEVEVLVPKQVPGPQTGEQRDDAFWQQLIDSGLISSRPRPELIDDSFEPIPNPGEPISDTIIRERR